MPTLLYPMSNFVMKYLSMKVQLYNLRKETICLVVTQGTVRRPAGKKCIGQDVVMAAFVDVYRLK